jgi:hypothetical protein
LVRGDDPLKIMQRAGHADFETARIYLREAENLAQGFGDVLPPLPGSLLRRTGPGDEPEGFATVSDSAIAVSTNRPKTSDSGWADRDSNPVKMSVPSVAERGEKPVAEAPEDDAERPAVSAPHPSGGAPERDAVEAALASALAQAATAGRFDVVAQLARELEARRLARAGNVVTLNAHRDRKGGA